METQTEQLGQWVDQYGDDLFRFAMSRVRDQDIAEDLVQTAFVSALKSVDSFEGRSSPKTWLFGILKYKILDHFRAEKRKPVTELSELNTACQNDFQPDGHWKEAPAEWELSPDRFAETEELQLILWKCINALPERLRHIFLSRDIDGASTEEICEAYDLTTSNFGVTMHRIRHRLRECFTQNGIGSRK